MEKSDSKSAYSKNALQQYISETTILYIDPNKKRTDSWLSLNRLQLPLGENRYSSIRKIAYADGKVKVYNKLVRDRIQEIIEASGRTCVMEVLPNDAYIQVLDAYLEANGYENDFSDIRLHHEIYLSDARKVAPEKWKTVIRHPIKGKGK